MEWIEDPANWISQCLDAGCSALAAISPLHLLGALVALGAMQLLRSLAWRNVLRSAFPGSKVPFKGLAAAYLIGAAMNACLPGHLGDPAKLFLAKKEISNSRYPALASSLASLSIFDVCAGLAVVSMTVASGRLTQELAPSIPLEIALPAIVLAAAAVAASCARSPKVKEILASAARGVSILKRPIAYLKEVVLYQAGGWALRIIAFSLMLQAFGISGSLENVFLVMSVHAIAGSIPIAPGGAGAQQALLIATISGPGSAIVAYSIGAQLATTAFALLLGMVSLSVVFKTSDWRRLIRESNEEAGKAPEEKLALPSFANP